jgi:hypothetical protein
MDITIKLKSTWGYQKLFKIRPVVSCYAIYIPPRPKTSSKKTTLLGFGDKDVTNALQRPKLLSFVDLNTRLKNKEILSIDLIAYNKVEEPKKRKEIELPMPSLRGKKGYSRTCALTPEGQDNQQKIRIQRFSRSEYCKLMCKYIYTVTVCRGMGVGI